MSCSLWALGTPTLNMMKNTTKQVVKWSLILVSVLHSGGGKNKNRKNPEIFLGTPQH